MKKVLIFAAILLSINICFAFTTGSDVHLSGYIDDSMCAGSKTTMSMGMSRINCVKKCLKSGASAVFVSGDKVYKITNQKAVLKYAGENVTIDGNLTDDTIDVVKITEDKN
jgi:hypothetical protein